MKEYKRDYPMFSLCGLNCGLCQRYNVSGSSKCPGCGGPDFHLKHPTCAVITCNKKHDAVEFCFQCSSFPCERYAQTSEQDSFITYQKVLQDFQKVKAYDAENYMLELQEKMDMLSYLLEHYNDGKKKSYYCTAVNLLDVQDLREIMDDIEHNISATDNVQKEQIKAIVDMFEEKALKRNIFLGLRK